MKPPASLHQLQQWFGNQIAQRPNPSFHIQVEDAKEYISPSATLHQKNGSKSTTSNTGGGFWMPCKKISFCHAPLWIDQLSIGDCYPLSPSPSPTSLGSRNTRGYTSRMAAKMLSSGGSRACLEGCRNRSGSQKRILCRSTHSYNFAHLSSHEILAKQLTLQTHLHLFMLKSDLFSFRDAFLEKEVEYWK